MATNVNDGTIPTVNFGAAPSSFLGDLNILTTTSLTQNAVISGIGVINISVGGTNAALNANADISSQNGAVTLQATGALTVGANVTVSSNGAVFLAADLTPSGVGDDGVGTLAIGTGAAVYGTSITLQGAEENIASTATVGNTSTAGVNIQSSLPARPMSLGGTNNRPVAGINLLSNELCAHIHFPNRDSHLWHYQPDRQYCYRHRNPCLN